MTDVTFLALAESDLLRLYAESENRAVGGGEKFTHEIEKVLRLICRLPRLGRVVGAPYRRVKLSRFPFSRINVVEGRRLLIHAIASDREPLEMLLRRLRQR